MAPKTSSRKRGGTTAGNNNVAAGAAAARMVPLATAFLLGCAVCTTLTMLLAHKHYQDHHHHDGVVGGLGGFGTMIGSGGGGAPPGLPGPMIPPPPGGGDDSGSRAVVRGSIDGDASSSGSSSLLRGTRILVAIASYDFSQIPHLEEVLDSYRDVCEAGAIVHLTIHTTQPYPVALIDLLNSRLRCLSPEGDYRITVVLKSPSVRLHLVDYHRKLFYDHLDEYDLFLYSEDDIRVTPTTVAAYLSETRRIQSLLLSAPGSDPSDYNVGIVRYEYDYPPDVVINDATRHATERVTRVYWEHLGKPVVPGSVDLLTSNDSYPNPIPSQLRGKYVTMTNHHQGMFMATPSLLRAWRDRSGSNCRFDVVRDRPGMKKRPSQPTEGTQRVWMSSHMLHGARHCGVRQILPIDRFGELTVHHLPNKNYRRVGKKGRLGGGAPGAKENDFGDGSDAILGDMPDGSLVGEMEMHVELRKNFPSSFVGDGAGGTGKYRGVIRMVDEIDPRSGFFKGKREHGELVRERMMRYREYVARGGVMSDVDVEDVERDLAERRRQRGVESR